ncbi:MAG: type II toxin-antitoxin system VapC family toxin [Ktedonobacterales bacterium]
MTRYLLDNGPLVALVKGRPGAERMIRPWVEAGEVATSQIVYGEAIEYIVGDDRYAQRRDELRAFLRVVKPLGLSYPILERYARPRRSMRAPYGSGLIGDIDTLIATTALHHGLTLVTLDSDFTRVPGLSLLRLERAALG